MVHMINEAVCGQSHATCDAEEHGDALKSAMIPCDMIPRQEVPTAKVIQGRGHPTICCASRFQILPARLWSHDMAMW